MSEDLAYIHNLWDLDASNNPVQDLDTKKKQFAFKIWKEDYINLQKREDSKLSELKDLLSDIYQLIGLYSVFQGVWFQGVAQLAPQTRCRDSIIPIILSVLVSIATIVGVHLKLEKVIEVKRAFFKNKLRSQVQESRIGAFGLEGLNFNLSLLEENTGRSQRSIYEKELEKLHQTRLLLLTFLTILSAFFACSHRNTLANSGHL